MKHPVLLISSRKIEVKHLIQEALNSFDFAYPILSPLPTYERQVLLS